ncbi:E3 ubiquitin-protein ligase ICP0 [Caprine alphaherpesvirus 1]|uniref:RING-type E3 ubiquitin transferase n=1 Tax=Caprine alphaherpesvirus 1 TaxID=39944 RepID=A0AAF1D222_9ALPH|nr:E3 ubiquitin-protein ligase ICP0 [Caprine alphaherpesvirus 1]QBM10902.1 E3 ubiquitin-protein ligase ICP0 [Caprine alphaherpesvirus 1]
MSLPAATPPGPAAASEPGPCCICLDAIAASAAARALPCLHAFCLSCIQRWLDAHPTCPLCKAPVASLVHSVASDECFVETPVGCEAPAGGPDAAAVWGEDYDAAPLSSDDELAGGGVGEGGEGGDGDSDGDPVQDFIDRVARSSHLPVFPNTPEHGPGAPYLRRLTEWVQGGLAGSLALPDSELAVMADHVVDLVAECGFDSGLLTEVLDPILGGGADTFVRSMLYVAARCVDIGSRAPAAQPPPARGRGVVFLDTSDSSEDSGSESEESSSGLSTSDLTAIDDTEADTDADADADAGARAGVGRPRARRPATRQYVSTGGLQTPAARSALRSRARSRARRAAASAPPRSQSPAGPRPARERRQTRPRPARRGRSPCPSPPPSAARAARARPGPRPARLALARDRAEEESVDASEREDGGQAGSLGGAGEPPRVRACRRRGTDEEEDPEPAAPPFCAPVIDLTADEPAEAPAEPPAEAPAESPARSVISRPAQAPSATLAPAPSPRRAETPSPARPGQGAARGPLSEEAADAEQASPSPESLARKRRRTEMEVAAWVRENFLKTPRRDSDPPAPPTSSRPGWSLAEILSRCKNGGGAGC